MLESNCLARILGLSIVCSFLALGACADGSSTVEQEERIEPAESGDDAGARADAETAAARDAAATTNADSGSMEDVRAQHDAGGADSAPSEPGPREPTEPDAAQPRADAGSDASVLCRPSAGGPYHLLEGETVTLTIRCETGLQAAGSLSIDPLPLGAAFDEATATLTWTPTLDQAAVYELVLRVSSGAETGSVVVAVADRWDASGNVPVVDPSRYTEELGLPVLHLTTDPGLNDDAYTPATIVYRGHSYTGAEARYRGTVSAGYPKRSFTLKFTKQDKFSDPSVGDGFLDKRKITLITAFDDNSYLRQRMSYELWNRLDPEHIKIESFSAVLFLNGQYYGLYTVADHINGYLMEDHGLFQDGNLYKGRSGDANFHPLKSSGEAKATLHDGFSKEEGLPVEGQPGAYDDLDSFLGWIDTSSAASFASEIDSRMRRSDYENWWIFTTFTMADDSVGKNSYHYHDPTLPGSRWRCVPWDFNHSFGQDWRTQRVAASATHPEIYYFAANGIFERLLRDPQLGPALRMRYDATLRGSYALEPVLALLDSMIAEVDASARRDEQKWQAVYRGYGSWKYRSDFTSYEEELQYLRQWILDRHAYLDTLY